VYYRGHVFKGEEAGKPPISVGTTDKTNGLSTLFVHDRVIGERSEREGVKHNDRSAEGRQKNKEKHRHTKILIEGTRIVAFSLAIFFLPNCICTREVALLNP
jgi:hypothetical protein